MRNNNFHEWLNSTRRYINSNIDSPNIEKYFIESKSDFELYGNNKTSIELLLEKSSKLRRGWSEL